MFRIIRYVLSVTVSLYILYGVGVFITGELNVLGADLPIQFTTLWDIINPISLWHDVINVFADIVNYICSLF
jgi:hypothetical protein